jgi:hypothetical protein
MGQSGFRSNGRKLYYFCIEGETPQVIQLKGSNRKAWQVGTLRKHGFESQHRL